MPYIIMLKIRKFREPTANRFCKARQKLVEEGVKAPDPVVSWSDFSLLHIIVKKVNRICHIIFHASTGFVIFT